MKSQARRYQPRELDGILLLDKPEGVTSNAALQAVKRLYRAAKAGHTGSLDPLATGLLPVCFGSATKVSSFLLDSDKSYLVTGQLGASTDSGDADGTFTVVDEPVKLELEHVKRVLTDFEGKIKQIPPMYSALKYKGRRLYELAREGIEVPREPRPVTIHALQLKNIETTKLTLRVDCSKGTYIRTLIEDIAQALGTVGYVTELRRLGVGPFNKNQMITMGKIEANAADGLEALDSLLLPVDYALQNWPSVRLEDKLCRSFSQGQAVQIDSEHSQIRIRVYSCDNVFIGMGEVREKGELVPRRIFTSTALLN
jgi:tRNA pseudouridine55 synthase